MKTKTEAQIYQLGIWKKRKYNKETEAPIKYQISVVGLLVLSRTMKKDLFFKDFFLATSNFFFLGF